MHFIQSHPAFNDTIESLQHEYMNDTSNSVVICGAHELSKTHMIGEYRKIYDRVIVFNQEPLLAKQRNFMHPLYFAWLNEADEVWDYDDVNIQVLKLFRPDVKLHILKPYKEWPTESEKDNEILFYGTMNTHRAKILESIGHRHKLKILTNCWDSKELDRWILRSRILLNLHYYNESSLQEQARMIRWIGAPCRIISETSVHNYLDVEEKTETELISF